MSVGTYFAGDQLVLLSSGAKEVAARSRRTSTGSCSTS